MSMLDEAERDELAEDPLLVAVDVLTLWLVPGSFKDECRLRYSRADSGRVLAGAIRDTSLEGDLEGSRTYNV